MKPGAALMQVSVAHARLSASSAERWMNCPGSVNLAESLPAGGATSFPAAEGTYAHAIAARCLAGGNEISSLPNWLGYKAWVEGHEVECDQEMVEGIQLYLDTVEKLRLDQSWIELSLTEALIQWDSDLGGTADFATYSPVRKLLRVADFKYGAGVFVSADDNRQLKQYALGALLAINKPVDTVQVYIVQPRYEGVEPVRVQSFPALQLLEFAGDVAHAAKASRLPDAPLNPGPWCAKTFCPNARTCPALEGMEHALMKQEFAEAKSPLTPFGIQSLSHALASVPLVKERIKAIEEYAYAQATAGVAIPGFKLVDKRPRRQWTDEKAVIEWAKGRAIEPFAEPALKSPAQLEKGLKKAEKAELGQFTASVSSGTTLVPEADARPAVSKMITVDDFAKIGGPANDTQQSPTLNLFE